MPDIWMDVDAAVTVPVNKVPVVASADGVTIDETIAYNESGMDLNWNFVTTAGVITQTNVVPTTGGDYDWAHVGNGMYKIEIPASGGASANNDTEGFGWFSGKADGICPFSSPIIGFRDSDLNDKLVDSAYSATRGLAGTALPDAAADAPGGLPISDAGGLDVDTLLAELGAANIPADIDSLLTRLTAARAGYLDELAAANIPADIDSLLARLTAARAGYLDNLNGHTAQSGDSYARLGAPAGASIAADLLVIDNLVDDVETRLTAARAGYLDELGAASIPADIDTLLARLTAARAGYLDKLNVSGTVAHSDAAATYKADVSALATAAKLLAYIQLLTRSDAAIGTDRATELGEINNDEGSGAGDFSNQTEAVEALRDRGDAAWVTATSVTVSDKTGFSLSAAGVDAILDETVESTLTLRQLLRVLLSALAGKSGGGGTVTLTFRDYADGKNRITATVDANGNRTAITLDAT